MNLHRDVLSPNILQSGNTILQQCRIGSNGIEDFYDAIFPILSFGIVDSPRRATSDFGANGDAINYRELHIRLFQGKLANSSSKVQLGGLFVQLFFLIQMIK